MSHLARGGGTHSPLRRSGSDLLVTRYEGQVVVLDRAASTYHHLNPLTTFVWEHCDGETPRAVLAREVDRVFGTDSADELVSAALERLRGAGLLEDDPAPGRVSRSPGTPPAPTR